MRRALALYRQGQESQKAGGELLREEDLREREDPAARPAHRRHPLHRGPTEVDALLLENSLIKEHQPRFNIELKDDKTYPSIVIRKERFPRVHATRQVIRNGSEYFGPYASVKTMHAVLDIVRKLHPIRTCKYDLSQKNIDAGKFRTCLEYDMGNCKAPLAWASRARRITTRASTPSAPSCAATSKTSSGTYDKAMKDASAAFAFEEAETHKRKKMALEKFQAKSSVVNPSIHDVEVYSVVSDPAAGYVNFMKIMDGGIVHGQTMEFRKRLDESDQELLEYGILEFRRRAQLHSPEIFTSIPVRPIVEDVKWHVPQRGDKKRLIELSERNAKYTMLDRRKQQEQVDPEAAQNRIMETLQKDSTLKELPVHIECLTTRTSRARTLLRLRGVQEGEALQGGLPEVQHQDGRGTG